MTTVKDISAALYELCSNHDRSIRNEVGNFIIPALLNAENAPVILETLVNEKMISTEACGYINRCFNAFMSISSGHKFDGKSIVLDIRNNEAVHQLIRTSLESNNVTAIKHATYLLKRILLLSDVRLPSSDSNILNTSYSHQWDHFFVALETIQDTSAHLVKVYLIMTSSRSCKPSHHTH
jgi:hypothetical protein